MSVLIVDDGLDFHARVVTVALKAMGHRAERLSLNRLASQDISITFEGNAVQVALPEIAPTFVPDTVWWARLVRPSLDSEARPADLALASQEWPLFIVGLEQLFAAHAWQVNRQEAARRTNAKALQLQLASECGLNIAPTLLTNSRPRAIAFIDQCRQTGGEVILKLQGQQIVEHRGKRTLTSARTISCDEIPPEQAMRRVPVQLQHRIEKAFEVRVVVFGDSVFAARLNAPHLQDWRLHAISGEVPILPWQLPDYLARACLALMGRLGIVTGSFDFIVTPNGQYFFLEVNEMGRFLWIEEACPQLPLLDAFCRFLVSRDDHFTYAPCQGSEVTLACICKTKEFAQLTAEDVDCTQ